MVWEKSSRKIYAFDGEMNRRPEALAPEETVMAAV